MKDLIKAMVHGKRMAVSVWIIMINKVPTSFTPQQV